MIEQEVEVEVYDAQSALTTLLRAHGAFATPDGTVSAQAGVRHGTDVYRGFSHRSGE